MFTPLATKRQIVYLQALADRAEHLRMRHPSLIPQGLDYIRWELGITSEKASRCIQFYNEILNNADLQLYPRKKLAETEDLPA